MNLALIFQKAYDLSFLVLKQGYWQITISENFLDKNGSSFSKDKYDSYRQQKHWVTGFKSTSWIITVFSKKYSPKKWALRHS